MACEHVMSDPNTASLALYDGLSDDDEESVHSAISNPSDFDDDEEVEYLAMELVNHLPREQASKLLKNMRTKEKAVQDLLHRNKSLLQSCQQLDQENQALSDRLRETEDVVNVVKVSNESALAATALPSQSDPRNVDMSFFQKMERGKEEKILILQSEREQLLQQAKRLDEGRRYLESALETAKREIKKLQQQVRSCASADAGGQSTGGASMRAVGSSSKRTGEGQVGMGSLLDEEERIYQELQGKTGRDHEQLKLQQRQDEYKKRIQSALQALLAEDLDRIQQWSSDISALLLAVDGLEAAVRPSGKASNKKVKPQASAESHALDIGEKLSVLQDQLLDDLESLKVRLETSEKAQLSLEQTIRGVHDGAGALVVAMDLPGSLAAASREVEWLGQHLAQAKGLSLDSTVLGHTEAAVSSLLCNAPPGLLPPNVKECLEDAQFQISELCKRLGEQAVALANLQDDGMSHLQALQAAHQIHSDHVKSIVTDELQRSAKTCEQPLDQMRGALRHQSEAVTKSRERMLPALEELSCCARRLATSSDGFGASGGGDVHSGNYFMLGGLREVRGMGKHFMNGLEDSAKALESRMQKITAALFGEDCDLSTDRGRSTPQPGTTSGDHAGEAKKKKGKKKGRVERDASPPHDAGSGSAAFAKTSEQLIESTPSGAAQDRLQRVPACSSSTPQRNVLSGPELLQELQALKGQSEALEARMAERRKAKASQAAQVAGYDEVQDLQVPDDATLDELVEEAVNARGAPKSRRKKMFV